MRYARYVARDRRWWLERAAIVVAAYATLATSRARWRIDAEKPATENASIARVIVVEASHPPEIFILWDSGGRRTADALEKPPWTGRGSFVIPENAKLEDAYITDYCKGGCFSNCTPPDDAHVRIVASTVKHTWKLEASTDAVITKVLPDMTSRERFKLTASHPVRITERSDSPAVHATREGDYIVTSWPWVEKAAEIRWSFHVLMEQPCAGDGPCKPPPDAKLVLGKRETVTP